jgi:hypothetical protein
METDGGYEAPGEQREANAALIAAAPAMRKALEQIRDRSQTTGQSFEDQCFDNTETARAALALATPEGKG